MHAHYYIAKGHKTLGPCSTDDLRNYLAYGSIRGGDLVKRADEEEWRPVSSFEELHLAGKIAADGLAVKPMRRRVACYRDPNRVPYDQRAHVVLRRMILGFFLMPPLLWQAAVSLYSDEIFTNTKDENGYLRVWGRWVEVLVTVMIIINAIVWCVILLQVDEVLGPGLKSLFRGMGEAVDAVKGLLRDAGW